MKYLLLGCCLALASSAFATGTITPIDPEKPRKKLSLEKQAEQGRIDSKKLEQSQLDKARAASQATVDREQDVLTRQESSEWQNEQREKAKTQFDDRAERENKYLKQAQEAAAKEKQISEQK
ncbi:hypothetical protein [Shewanella sp. OMA3-2]|uniref:hypothetical protein n=1 Tax=Shewanella sp. OMA3-2 TaxID=2908650 RepID=UPI001F334CAD|nr:hypothetical protein [Shewanella sp. OMA3-2]UJF22430.1 hypothetical protein L0B17_03125 [Shewanella sp. OMA3-2]